MRSMPYDARFRHLRGRERGLCPQFTIGRSFERGVVTACIRMVLNLGLVVRHAEHALRLPEFNTGCWFKRGVVTACIRMVLNLGLAERHAGHALRLLQRRVVPEFNTVCWFKRGVGVGGPRLPLCDGGYVVIALFRDNDDPILKRTLKNKKSVQG